jgi:hypothetical protein
MAALVDFLKETFNTSPAQRERVHRAATSAPTRYCAPASPTSWARHLLAMRQRQPDAGADEETTR